MLGTQDFIGMISLYVKEKYRYLISLQKTHRCVVSAHRRTGIRIKPSNNSPKQWLEICAFTKYIVMSGYRKTVVVTYDDPKLLNLIDNAIDEMITEHGF